jgi:MFS family permease
MDSTNDSLLSNARFLRLWIGQGASFVGDAVSMVALVVLVVQVTGSASAVGGALVARLLPTIASPLAGVIADRVDRRIVLVASDLARAVLVLGLVFARDLATIYVLVFLMGLARTVFNPTVRAAFPSVVGGGDLTRANALISGTFSTSIMVGPALGGLLVASIGVDAAFLADAVTYLVSAILLSTVPLPHPRRESEEEAGFVRELRSGFGYLLGTRVPLAIVVGAFLTILTINATVPAEVFLAKETFGAGDVGYGLLVSLWGGGMVLGSAMMAVLGNRINLVLLYFLSIFVGASALVGTGLAPAFILALGALTVEGAATGIDNVATDTILQKRVPEAFLGRVFSIRFLAYSAGEALAYPLGGLLVDTVGPRSTYILAGIATAAAGLLVLLTVMAAPISGREQADRVP